MMPSSQNVPQATTPPSQCEINSKTKFTAKHIYIEELEKFQMKNLTLCLKELGGGGKESYTQIEQHKKDINNIRVEINEIENRKIIQKINPTNSSFFEKINKIDMPLARLARGKGRIQTNKVINEKGDITTKIQRIIISYHE